MYIIKLRAVKVRRLVSVKVRRDVVRKDLRYSSSDLDDDVDECL